MALLALGLHRVQRWRAFRLAASADTWGRRFDRLRPKP